MEAKAPRPPCMVFYARPKREASSFSRDMIGVKQLYLIDWLSVTLC